MGFLLIRDPCGYLMLSGDDSIYPKNYVEKILERFQKNPDLVVASGNIKHVSVLSEAPQGSGRIFDMKWLRKHMPFPISSAWESGILFEALAEGKEIKCFNDLTFDHTHRYSSYSLRTFGHAMYVLGYFPLMVLGRLVLSFIRGNIPRLYVFAELLGYVEYTLASPEKPCDMRDAISMRQKRRIVSIVGNLFTFKHWRRKLRGRF